MFLQSILRLFAAGSARVRPRPSFVAVFYVASLHTALRGIVFLKLILRLFAAGSARVRPRPHLAVSTELLCATLDCKSGDVRVTMDDEPKHDQAESLRLVAKG